MSQAVTDLNAKIDELGALVDQAKQDKAALDTQLQQAQQALTDAQNGAVGEADVVAATARLQQVIDGIRQ